MNHTAIPALASTEVVLLIQAASESAANSVKVKYEEAKLKTTTTIINSGSLIQATMVINDCSFLRDRSYGYTNHEFNKNNIEGNSLKGKNVCPQKKLQCHEFNKNNNLGEQNFENCPQNLQCHELNKNNNLSTLHRFPNVFYLLLYYILLLYIYSIVKDIHNWRTPKSNKNNNLTQNPAMLNLIKTNTPEFEGSCNIEKNAAKKLQLTLEVICFLNKHQIVSIQDRERILKIIEDDLEFKDLFSKVEQKISIRPGGQLGHTDKTSSEAYRGNVKKAMTLIKKTNRTKRARELVSFFRIKLIEYYTNNGIKPSFAEKFNTTEMKPARRLLSAVPDVEEIHRAIIWFLGNSFWADKITSLNGVEKHFLKYQMQSNKTNQPFGKNRDWLMGYGKK